MNRKSPPIAPLIPLIVGMIAISFAPILVRYSDAPVSVQGMYRMLFTVLLMLPFGARQLRTARSIGRKDWLLLGLAGFFLALHFLLWMESLNYTSIASSTIILTLEPVFVMIGAYFAFKDKIGKLPLLGLALGLAGAFVVGSGDFRISGDAFQGDVLSFLGMLAIVANMLLAKVILRRVSAYLYSLIVFAIAFVCFAVYNGIAEFNVINYMPREWLIFVLLAIVPTVLGHMIFNWLLQYVKPTTVSMTVLAEPVGASLLGLVLFQEMLSGFQLIGGGLIIVGLLLYLKTDSPASPSARTAAEAA
ncbi:DMT family transporter [Paenibacillaceae bacterium WGS1546]|uniref:DMT family transporter n=1 Tax=Cohnella sp. WGS1546 TaxID=3366810 RepID=UPI00372D2A7B